MTDSTEPARDPRDDDPGSVRVSTGWLKMLQSASECPAPLVVDHALDAVVASAFLGTVPFDCFVQLGAASLEPVSVAATQLERAQVRWYAAPDTGVVDGPTDPMDITQPIDIGEWERPALVALYGDATNRADAQADAIARAEDLVVLQCGAPRPVGEHSTMTPLLALSSGERQLTVSVTSQSKAWPVLDRLIDDLRSPILHEALERHFDVSARALADRTVIDRSKRSARGDFRPMLVEAHLAERGRMATVLNHEPTDVPATEPPAPTDPLLRALLRLKYRVGRSAIGSRLLPYYTRRFRR